MLHVHVREKDFFLDVRNTGKNKENSSFPSFFFKISHRVILRN
jgi:hypothetical protein